MCFAAAYCDPLGGSNVFASLKNLTSAPNKPNSTIMLIAPVSSSRLQRLAKSLLLTNPCIVYICIYLFMYMRITVNKHSVTSKRMMAK